MPVNRQDTVDTSELLRELRIDRDGRPPRTRRRRLVVAVVALVVLGAGAWLAWSRISTPAVRTVAARAATPAGGGVRSALGASGYVRGRRAGHRSAQIAREGT